MIQRKSQIQVGEIRCLLKEKSWSPEVFAKEVGLSHMTIRRWLEKRDNILLPQKYYVTLAPHLNLAPASPGFADSRSFQQVMGGFSATNVGEMVADLERSGRDFQEISALNGDVGKKFKKERFDKIFVDHCKLLLKAVFSKDTPASSKAIAIGALLYFLNPVDLIPDQIPVIGYLDDLAVLTLAVNALANSMTKQTPELKVSEA